MTAGPAPPTPAPAGSREARVDIAGRLRDLFGTAVLRADEFRGDLAVTVARERFHELMRALRDEPDLDFAMLLDVTAMDYLDLGRLPRFDVVYHLYSLTHHRRIRVKVPLEEDDCWVPTVTDLWLGADWPEREAWDLYGVVFEGHPNLFRILCHEDFQGHPLRKDFPADKRFFLVRPTDLRAQAPEWVRQRSPSGRAGGYIAD